MIERVQTRTFNIVDLLDEMNTLKATISEELLKYDERTAFANYVTISSLLDEMFRAVAVETAAVFEEIIERTPRAICLLDEESTVTYANEAAAHLLDEKDLTGAKLEEWATGDNPQYRLKGGNASQRFGEIADRSYALTVPKENDVVTRLTAETHRLRDSGVSSKYFCLLDIPHSSTWVNEAALDNFSIGILRINSDREVYYANREACEIVGVTRLENNIAVKELVHDDDLKTVSQQIDERRKGNPGEYQIKIRRFDHAGEERYTRVRVIAFPEREPDGRFTGTIAYVESLIVQDAAEEMKNAISETTTGTDLLGRICSVLSGVFEQAFMVMVYQWNKEMTHSSEVYTLPGESGEWVHLQIMV